MYSNWKLHYEDMSYLLNANQIQNIVLVSKKNQCLKYSVDGLD